MIQDIFVGILCVIALGAGVWVWWLDNVGSKAASNREEKKEQGNEKN